MQNFRARGAPPPEPQNSPPPLRISGYAPGLDVGFQEVGIVFKTEIAFD